MCDYADFSGSRKLRRTERMVTVLFLVIVLLLLTCRQAQGTAPLEITAVEVLSTSSAHVSWQLTPSQQLVQLEASIQRPTGDDQKGACNDIQHSSVLDLSVGSQGYTFVGLMADSTYSFTLVAKHNSTIKASDGFTTFEAAPSASPLNVQVFNITAMEVTVDWKEVPCIDRNSNITMFAIRFVIIEAGGGQSGGGISLVEGSAEVGGESTLGDLFGSTNYSISVAAQNTRGEMGPYSAPITVETLPCVCPAEQSNAALIGALTVSTFVGTSLVFVGVAIIVAVVYWRWRKEGGAKEVDNDDNTLSNTCAKRWCVSPAGEGSSTAQTQPPPPHSHPTNNHGQDSTLPRQQLPPPPVVDALDCYEDEDDYYANEEEVRSMTSQFSCYFTN